MQEIADYVSVELLKRSIKTRIRQSKKSQSLYIMCKHMPEIRISDHIGTNGIKAYTYNIVIGNKSIMANKTTIMIHKNKAVFYYSPEDVDKLVNSYEVLYKKKSLT